MPCLYEREEVATEYERARREGWVLAALGVENLTTIEAVLSAALAHSKKRNVPDLPVILAITNLYDHRSQTLHYTHTWDWRMGLKLFLSDIAVLCGPDSPFADLRVMIHLDHIQPGEDRELLEWDMGLFSSIMYDASTFPFDQNIEMTADFVKRQGGRIFVEGACDEIAESGQKEKNELTTADQAEQFVRETGCDIIVPNLGTEHRADGKELRYAEKRALELKERVGKKLCLHGASSVQPEQLHRLSQAGVVKVNFWTALERDSSPLLLEDMVRNAGKVAGIEKAKTLQASGLLGSEADVASKAALSHCTTSYRQSLVFDIMQKMVEELLDVFMPPKGGTGS